MPRGAALIPGRSSSQFYFTCPVRDCFTMHSYCVALRAQPSGSLSNSVSSFSVLLVFNFQGIPVRRKKLCPAGIIDSRYMCYNCALLVFDSAYSSITDMLLNSLWSLHLDFTLARHSVQQEYGSSRSTQRKRTDTSEQCRIADQEPLTELTVDSTMYSPVRFRRERNTLVRVKDSKNFSSY